MTKYMRKLITKDEIEAPPEEITEAEAEAQAKTVLRMCNENFTYETVDTGSFPGRTHSTREYKLSRVEHQIILTYREV
jgi:hypothetical protein